MLLQIANATPHIDIAAEEVFKIGFIPVTNSMILNVFSLFLTAFIFLKISKELKTQKRRGFVSRLFIWIYSALRKQVFEIIPDRNIARIVAPIPITMFFFIMISYYLGILPIVGTISVGNGDHMVHLFRGPASDLNFTLGLAIVSIVGAQIYAIKVHGFFGNLSRYIRNPLTDPAGAFEGLLEIIAEFSRMISLTLRLFGNVFAGEILIMMIAFLSGYGSPIALPIFYLFELFIGAIQSYIFFMLTTIFTSLGVAHLEHSETSSSDTQKMEGEVIKTSKQNN